VFQEDHAAEGLIHASAVKSDVWNADEAGIITFEEEPLNCAASWPVGLMFDAPPNVTDVAVPPIAALPVPAAEVDPLASFNTQ
jgi:hypothetical protein